MAPRTPPKRRKPLRAAPGAGRDLTALRAAREEAFRRDAYRCRFPHRLWPDALPCIGLSAHHLHKRSQGGGDDPENLLTVCPAGNDAVEDRPALARELGLVVDRGVDAAEAARRRDRWRWSI